ncbi:MAG TPA: NAD(P)/FAD-dependent oxidoreductase [Steroidobacteraceae bacterium]|nr:NAD(P)/FAD-dependent oxidoreductase [Steroidobacteraceae bacterium]
MSDSALSSGTPSPAAPIAAEAVIIGAGPVGLFQIFELGLLGIKAHIIDSLAQAGGQCTELYPEKPIYDIPALPVCGAQELVDRLMEQAKPFHATFHLGEEVTEVRCLADGKFRIATAGGTELIAGAVVIAGGLGSFQPRRLAVPGIEAYEGTQVHYRIRSSAEFHGRDLVICGGGDSALDWTVALCGKARSLSLVHRRAEFRAAPATVARMRELVAAGSMQLIEGNLVAHESQDHKLVGVEIQSNDGRRVHLTVQQVLAFFGLHPKLGPIADWGLELEKKALKVDTEKFQTSVPGIFAIGDINTYAGKKKLILSGFHEAALAAFGVQAHLFPGKRQFLQYTTTSPIMQKRLGLVGAPEP